MFRLFIVLNVVLSSLSTNLVMNPGAETSGGWSFSNSESTGWQLSSGGSIKSGSWKFATQCLSHCRPLSQNITSLVVGSHYEFYLWANGGSGSRLNVSIDNDLLLSGLLTSSYMQYKATFMSEATTETLAITSISSTNAFTRVDDVFIGIISNPTGQPTLQPTLPTGQPTSQPSIPTGQPTSQPSIPTGQPTGQPTRQPTRQPFSKPTSQPSRQPTGKPSRQPFSKPTCQPTAQPTAQPSTQPSMQPSDNLVYNLPYNHPISLLLNLF
jgi:hypothetical protein